MKRWLLLSLVGWLALGSVGVGAETLVLVPGYLSDGYGWRESGVTQALEQDGWADAGHLRAERDRIQFPGGYRASGLRFYTLDLDSQAPLVLQVRQLAAILEAVLARYPGESLILAGHSAGGVVARLYMVEHAQAAVSALITIASPHLGTESAELGLMAGQSPLGWVSGLLGIDTLNRSQGLYADLARERPGSLLYGLNRREHPVARYVSVVRASDIGDLVVPTWSQDMNHVYALYGRAVRIETDGGHGLHKDDGRLLVRILMRLRSS